MLRNIFLTAVAVAAMLSLHTAARADGIVFVGPDDCFPAGVGRGCGDARAPHVLSLQSQGSATTETGSVGRSTSSPATDVRTGDWLRGSNTQTVSLTEIGITQGSQLRIFFDIIEPNGGNRSAVTLNTLVLTAYNQNGVAVFSAALVGAPLTLEQRGNGQGHSDYAFGLDAAAAARLQAAIAANPNLRVGLMASVTSAQGGPESFFIGSAPAAVPEPATMILLGTGLAGAAGAIRKRRQTVTKV